MTAQGASHFGRLFTHLFIRIIHQDCQNATRHA